MADVKPRSAIRLQFDIMGERQVSRMFTSLREVPQDWSKPFNKMADDWFDYNKETFDEMGPGWRELSKSTLRSKDNAGYGGKPILVRSGLLKDSLTVRGAPEQVLNITSTTMQLGTQVPYAMYHQTGNLKPARMMAWGKPMLDANGNQRYAAPGTHPPKRPPVRLPFDTSLKKKWTDRIVRWLRESVDYVGDR